MAHRYSPFLILLLIGLVSLGGCAGTKTPVHPGSANAFDSSTYDALVTIQAGIEQAKVGITDAKKPLLNKIIQDYNLAEKAYAAYHAMALQGTASASAQADLQKQVDALKSNLASLGGK